MPDVGDIHFRGCREVVVELADGTIERYRLPFGSQREVLDFLVRIARRAGHSELAKMAPDPVRRVRADA